MRPMYSWYSQQNLSEFFLSHVRMKKVSARNSNKKDLGKTHAALPQSPLHIPMKTQFDLIALALSEKFDGNNNPAKK